MREKLRNPARPAQTALMVAGIVPLACALGAVDASAQEYCVACTSPNAVYRCVIDGARPGRQSLQMLCLAALTKEGGHATCSVKGGTVFECNGPIRRVPWAPEGAERTTSEPPPAKARDQADEQSPEGKQAPKGEPKTVVELAKKANEQMQKTNENIKDQAKSTGEAIGKATKKTWDCLLSFFFRC